MRRLLALVTLSVAACALHAPRAHGQARDPDLVWLTLETPHFKIHYHEPLGVMAREVAAVAERAHERLTPLFRHVPRERTHVVLSDNSDDANGLARVLPYNTMELYATAPEDLSALDDYDNWLVTLVTHEYTHILHLDTIGGIPKVLNTITGKNIAPNSMQPRWFIEGIAVLEESKHSAGGRERSSVFEMFMRMDALDGKLLSLDQMSNPVDRWPWGTVPYLYGSRFMQYLADTYGHDALAAISHDYGEQLIPYALSRTAKRATGKPYPDLYADFRHALTAESRATAKRVDDAGRIEGKQLTFGNEYSRSPRFIDEDSIAYWVSDGHAMSEVRTVPARGGASTRAFRANGPGSLAVRRSDGLVVYSQANIHKDIYAFNDLHSFDPATGRTLRLTDGARAREPDISADGTQVAYTVNGAGTTHLMVAALNTAVPMNTAAPLNATLPPRVLLRNPRHGQVYTPRWSPDGRTIAVSLWRRGGYRDIALVDARTGALRDVTHDRALDTGPAWSPDGKTLYFASDRTGISNLYAYDVESRALRQVSNVVGGAFQPDVSPSGKRIAYLGYTSRGFDVFSLEVKPETFVAATPYEDTRPGATFLDTGAYESLRPTDYQPLETLGPRSFEAELTTDNFGQALSLTTFGRDAVGFHSWAARVGVGFEEGNIDAEGSWTYQRLPSPISVSLFHNLAPRNDLVVGGQRRDWVRRTYGGELSIAFRLPQLFESHSLSAGYALTETERTEPFRAVLDPNDPAPFIPITGRIARLRAGWSYSNVVQTRYDISPSWGRTFALRTSMSHPYLASESQALSLQWGASQYLENPWVEHHVLAVRYGGGLGIGAPGSVPTFAIGGFADASILDGLIDGIVQGGIALRGYAPSSRFGAQYHLLQTEYRFLLWRPQWGPGTLPFFVNRLWASAFADVGDAFDGAFTFDTLCVGAGGELLVDFTTAFYQPFTLRIGAAQGLRDGGVFQFYVNLGSPF
jgi:hypothetical protein